VRFEHKGTFSYHCEIHPSMHGKIVVGSIVMEKNGIKPPM